MTSRRHCDTTWVGSHASFQVACAFCNRLAVFHWRYTYPGLLLCRRHMQDYPEIINKKPEDFTLADEIAWGWVPE